MKQEKHREKNYHKHHCCANQLLQILNEQGNEVYLLGFTRDLLSRFTIVAFWSRARGTQAATWAQGSRGDSWRLKAKLAGDESPGQVCVWNANVYWSLYWKPDRTGPQGAKTAENWSTYPEARRKTSGFPLVYPCSKPIGWCHPHPGRVFSLHFAPTCRSSTD